MSGSGLCFDADQLRHLLPHRWPMLLIDRAYDVLPGVSGRGLKNVTISEPFFAGHFPQQSVMPGVLIVEAMAQLVAVVHATTPSVSEDPDIAARVGYLGAIRQMKFSRLVVPGDRLIMTAEFGSALGPLRVASVHASVDGAVAATGSLTVSLPTAKDGDSR
jgi:3-hydroxyacyl-[acyl-carrier-protein] dehydratase